MFNNLEHDDNIKCFINRCNIIIIMLVGPIHVHALVSKLYSDIFNLCLHPLHACTDVKKGHSIP